MQFKSKNCISCLGCDSELTSIFYDFVTYGPLMLDMYFPANLIWLFQNLLTINSQQDITQMKLSYQEGVLVAHNMIVTTRNQLTLKKQKNKRSKERQGENLTEKRNWRGKEDKHDCKRKFYRVTHWTHEHDEHKGGPIQGKKRLL